MNVRNDVGSTCARSSRHDDEPGDRLLCRCRGSGAPVRPEQCDADGAGVEPLRVSPDDVAVDTAEPALVHGAEAVDEKVVADVVPAVPLHVEELDALHDRRCLGPRVVVAARRVVDDGEPNAGGVARRPAPDRLVRIPRKSWDDRRRHRGRRHPVRHAELGAPDQVGAHTSDLSESTCLDAVGGAHPERVAELPAAAAPFVRAHVRRVLVLRSTRPPRAPAAVHRARPELHVS